MSAARKMRSGGRIRWVVGPTGDASAGVDPRRAAHWTLKFKTPKGRSESASNDSPGHTVVANVDVADGRLVRGYVDTILPEKPTTRSFARFYNNQNNVTGPLGTGWRHNLEGYILEDVPGRYAVFVDGSERVFEKCTLDIPNQGAIPEETKINGIADCKTDKTHGGKLSLTAASDDGGRTYKTFNAKYETEDGVAFFFDRLSEHYKELGRRRYLLTKIDDGLKEPLVFEYTDANVKDLVKRVVRGEPVVEATTGALTVALATGLSFVLTYDDEGLTDNGDRSQSVVDGLKLGFGACRRSKRSCRAASSLPA
jgi:hypothetical protein